MTPSRLRRLTPLVYVECDIREDETLRAWRRRSHPAARPRPARRLLRRAVRLRRA